MSYYNDNNYFKSPYQLHNEKEKQFERDIKRHQHHIQLLQNQNLKLKQEKCNSDNQYKSLLLDRDKTISQLFETNNYLNNQIKQIQRNEKYNDQFQSNRIKCLESQQYESTIEIRKLANEISKLKHENQEFKQIITNLKLNLYNSTREKDLKFKNLLIDNQKSLNKLKQFEVNQIEQVKQINQIRTLLNQRENEYQKQRNQDYMVNNEKLLQFELKLKQEKQKSTELKKTLLEIDMEFFKIVLNFEQEIAKRILKEKLDNEIINSLKVKLSNRPSTSPSPTPSFTNDKLERERKEKELRNTLLKQKQDAERNKENDKIIQKLKQRELQRRIEKEKSDELLRQQQKEKEKLENERLQREKDKLNQKRSSILSTPTRVSISSNSSPSSFSSTPPTSQQLEIIKRIESAKKPNDIFKINNLNDLKSIDTISNLKTQYRQYSKLIHPDKCLNTNDMFHKLKESYDILNGDLLISMSMYFK